MIAAPVPENETDRLQALHALSLLDTPAEDRFDRITRLAQKMFHVPIALVSLIDTDRQWFKSCQGLTARQTSREISFCGHAILNNTPFIIPDTLKDARFADNPLVTGEPKIRFYAGYPVKGPEGHCVGTLCLIDQQPRPFDMDQVVSLLDLASLVEQELRSLNQSEAQKALIQETEMSRRQALIDDLTLLWNRRAIFELLQRELAHAKRTCVDLTVAMLDLDHFKRINDQFGHPAGDAVLRESAQRMRSCTRQYDAVGRYGGEEFLILCPGLTSSENVAACERILEGIRMRPVEWETGPIAITASIGVATGFSSTEELLKQADAALYEAKRQGRDRVVHYEAKRQSHDCVVHMEHRMHQRYPVRFKSIFSMDGVHIVDGVVTDLSFKGCRLKSPIQIPFNITIELHIRPDQHAPVYISRAVVRWEVDTVFGLEFKELPELESATLTRLLWSLSS
jgi:diguanylate cyclase (GGDEF)-like protein